MKIANIIVNLSHTDVDRPFDYLIPENLNICIGMEVEVPFGNQKITGFVIDISQDTEIKKEKLKKIIKILHNGEILLHEEQINLAKLISNYYMFPLVATLNAMIPGELTGFSRTVSVRKMKFVSLLENANFDKIRANATRQKKIVGLLKNNNNMKLQQIKELAGIKGNQAINALIEKDIIKITETEHLRKPFARYQMPAKSSYSLTSDQENVVEAIYELMESRKHQQVLLHGVTGSGKTDIYIEAIKKCIEKKEQAILLVPEIALTSQIVGRLMEHFKDSIAVMHSNLSSGERYDEWRRIQKGAVDIVVGARSAIFSPLPNLGLIIIDEEHEGTYKQDAGLRYDARKVAQWRAEMNEKLIIYGSATPSVSTYYNAKTKKIHLLTLPLRVKDLPMPKFVVVDMREEYKKGSTKLISNLLHEKIYNQIYNKNSKVMLLLNRRGFSYQFVCSNCGKVLKCPNCDISMTYHKSHNSFKCHYCNYNQAVNMNCSDCGSKLIPLGEGIQKVEEELRTSFPDVKIIRMDSDSTTRKNSHIHLLEEFRNSKRTILLGTQMIAKGLDIPEVNLVGIVNADTSLNIPDYTADEKTFQLITQVAGRSGRGSTQGEVVLQTYSPGNEIIDLGCSHNYSGFYEIEITHRKKMNYPPYTQLIRIISAHKIEKIAYRAVKFIETNLKPVSGQFEILGPTPAPISKVRNNYRWHLVIKIGDDIMNRNFVKSKINEISLELRRRSQSLNQPLSLIIDIDPESIM